MKEVQKFPKVGLSIAIFEKWIHKATFWFQVPYWFYFDGTLKFFLCCFHWPYLLMVFFFFWVCFHCSWKWRPRSFIITLSRTLVFISLKVSKLNLEDFINHWKLELWEILFFHEFKLKGGILKNKTWQ